MNRSRHPSWAVIALAAVALTLVGCGRKAGLDAPPGNPSAATAAEPASNDPAAKSGLFDTPAAANAAPQASKGRKKPFILDPLLD